MSKKRIFITGGTGFFGKTLLRSAAAETGGEFQLTVLSREPRRFLDNFPEFAGAARFIAGDVRDFDFPAEHFDMLIHAATPASARLERENPQEMRSIILDGNRHVIDFARRAGVERVLFTSSGAVYGPQPPELYALDEDCPCRPATVYGTAKLEAEKMWLDSGVPVVIARCFAFVGEYLPLDEHFAAGNFMRDALAGRAIEISGDGRTVRSYLYGGELAGWLWALLRRGIPGRAYNVGSGEATTIAELAGYCAALNSPPSEVRIAEKAPAGAPPAPRYVPEVGRIAAELGLRQQVALPDALKRIFDYHLEHGRNTK